MKQSFQEASLLKTSSALIQNRSEHFVNDVELNATPGGSLLGEGVALFNKVWFHWSEPMSFFDCESVYVPRQCMDGDGKMETLKVAKLVSNMKSNGLVSLNAAVVIHQTWGNAFYHATVENLPRLAYVLDFLRVNPNVAIIAGSTLFNRRTEINKLLGLQKSQKWVVLDSSKSYFAKYLIVPRGSQCGSSQPKCVERIQNETNDYFLSKEVNELPDRKQGTPEKQIILLQKRQKRMIINHEELLNGITKAFHSCCEVIEYYGTESFADAAAMHYSADIVVGPHGAGLSFLIFTHRDRIRPRGMLELHPPGNVNGCHQATARAAGMETRLLQQKGDGKWGSNFSVNVTEAIEVLGDLLAKRGV